MWYGEILFSVIIEKVNKEYSYHINLTANPVNITMSAVELYADNSIEVKDHAGENQKVEQ